MRWFWIDRFVEFQSGRRAVAIKCVSLGEPHLHDYFPGFPVQPPSLVVEGIAQTGGILVGEYYGFSNRVVLAKISSAKFYALPRPGDQLRYELTIESIQQDGSMCRGVSYLGDKMQAEVELCFAHLNERNQSRELYSPAGFLRMLRAFGLYDVAIDANGQPAVIPQYLLDAERQDLGHA
ncbi:MAG: beta-hydroxyacyl-ACP dehydratase [Planctomycetota bacterium]|nr:beta-hydroxyacyl-ACP dehydratase [Planctomycetota bacterium]MDA1179906.1 beta-hydroxyacyl-ACP dehydratase [Planctomycetota bacterium]